MNEAHAIITSCAFCQQKIALGSPYIRVTRRKRRTLCNVTRSLLSCDLEGLRRLAGRVPCSCGFRASIARPRTLSRTQEPTNVPCAVGLQAEQALELFGYWMILQNTVIVGLRSVDPVVNSGYRWCQKILTRLIYWYDNDIVNDINVCCWFNDCY